MGSSRNSEIWSWKARPLLLRRGRRWDRAARPAREPHAAGPGEGKRVRAGASTDQPAIFPDASPTRAPRFHSPRASGVPGCIPMAGYYRLFVDFSLRGVIMKHVYI